MSRVFPAIGFFSLSQNFFANFGRQFMEKDSETDEYDEKSVTAAPRRSHVRGRLCKEVDNVDADFVALPLTKLTLS
jgi:hypothetical protein